MGLVSFLPPVEVPIPHEPGHTMRFKKPPQYVVRDARKVTDTEGRRAISDFGTEAIRAFSSGGKDDDEKVVRRTRQLEAASRYDVSNFDRDTLLNFALDGWSGPNYTKDGAPVPVTKEAIADLDEPTAAWAHETVVGMIRPPSAEESKSDAVGAGSGA